MRGANLPRMYALLVCCVICMRRAIALGSGEGARRRVVIVSLDHYACRSNCYRLGLCDDDPQAESSFGRLQRSYSESPLPMVLSPASRYWFIRGEHCTLKVIGHSRVPVGRTQVMMDIVGHCRAKIPGVLHNDAYGGR
jgi:hypothetical protein